MNLTNKNHRRLRKTARRAFTLVELLVAVGLGSLILGAMGLVVFYGSRSFAAMGNYVELDGNSRDTLDRVSREIRQAQTLTVYKTNQLTYVDNSGNTVELKWDPSSRQLTRKSGSAAPTVLLTECDYLRFGIYKRTPYPGATNVFYPATNSPGVYDVKYCKLIDVTWKCSRQIFQRKVNTESVQTAQIVIRNKHDSL